MHRFLTPVPSFSPLPRLAIVLAALACSAMPDLAAAADLPDDASRTAVVSIASGAITVDGALDDAAWAAAPRVTGFIERKPALGQVPADDTAFAVVVDGEALYVGVWCSDGEADAIRAATTAPDSFAIFGDDAISLKIDATLDRRTTLGFVLNPVGARLDYRGVNEKDMRAEVDAVWQGGARRTSSGWTAEFRVPWSSLGIDPTSPPAGVGLNFSRDHARRNATYDWSLMPPPFSPIAASHYGYLGGLQVLQGLARTARAEGTTESSWQVVPYVLTGYEPGRSQAAGIPKWIELDVGDGFGRIGLDATWRVGTDWKLQGTLNTDFAQADVDDQVINLSQFSLFVPEKRDFFLQDIELFSFGRSRQAQLFHSRTVGRPYSDGARMPILGGVKVVGRKGPVRVALVDTLSAQSNAAVVRTQVELGAGSFVGAMATSDASSLHADHAAGVDFAWRPASVPLLVEGYGLEGTSERTYLDPETFRPEAPVEARGGAAGLDASWRGSLWRPRIHYAFASPEVARAASLGYFRRTDLHEFAIGTGLEPRIGRAGLEKLSCDAEFSHSRDAGSLDPLDDYAGTVCSLIWDAGWAVSAAGRWQRETVRKAFPLHAGAPVAAGLYTQGGGGLQLATPGTRALSGAVLMEFGPFYGGKVASITPSWTWKPRTGLRFEASADWRQVRFDDGRTGFDSVLLNTRTAIGFSPDLNLDLFVGYNRLQAVAPLQARLRWTWRQASDVFVVYQHVVGLNAGNLGGDVATKFQSLLVKATWAWL